MIERASVCKRLVTLPQPFHFLARLPPGMSHNRAKVLFCHNPHFAAYARRSKYCHKNGMQKLDDWFDMVWRILTHSSVIFQAGIVESCVEDLLWDLAMFDHCVLVEMHGTAEGVFRSNYVMRYMLLSWAAFRRFEAYFNSRSVSNGVSKTKQSWHQWWKMYANHSLLWRANRHKSSTFSKSMGWLNLILAFIRNSTLMSCISLSIWMKSQLILHGACHTIRLVHVKMKLVLSWHFVPTGLKGPAANLIIGFRLRTDLHLVIFSRFSSPAG